MSNCSNSVALKITVKYCFSILRNKVNTQNKKFNNLCKFFKVNTFNVKNKL